MSLLDKIRLSPSKVKIVILTGALIITTILFLFSLNNRFIYWDEAWFGEEVYFFLKSGIIRNQTALGLIDMDQHFYAALKGHIFWGALFSAILGWDIWVLKFSSLIAFLALIVFSIFYFKKQSLIVLLIFLTLLFANSRIFFLSYTFRPEILVLLLSLAAYANYVKNQNSYIIVFSGLLWGLAAFVHLNAFIYLFSSIVISVFYFKNIKAAGWITLGFYIGFLPYFFDIHNKSEFEAFLYQFREQPGLSSNHFTIWYYFLKLLAFHKRLFHSETEIIFSVLTIFVTAFTYKKLTSLQKADLFFTILVLIFLTLINRDASAPLYYALLVPFFSILITNSYVHILYIKSWQRTFCYMLFFCFLVLNWRKDFEYAFFIKSKDNAAYNRKMLEDIPKFSKVMADIHLVFNEVKNYDLQSDYVFEFNRKIDTSLTVFSFAHQYKRDYVLLSGGFRECQGINRQNDSNPFYKFMFEKNDTYYYKSCY